MESISGRSTCATVLWACLTIPMIPSWFDATARAAEPIQAEDVFADAARRYEGFWRRIERDEPYPSMNTRKLLACALAYAQSRQYPERMDRLFELTTEAQDRDPESRAFGNLRWTWRDAGVTDHNAVEFVTLDALVVWIAHRDRLDDSSRETLRELLEFSVEGCLRHRVPTTYTNIALLNAANLLALGEQLDRPEVLEEGARRLEAVCVWTDAFGTAEYCSPTYYGVDLDGLLFIEKYVERPAAVEQARALLEFFHADIACNWFDPASRLAGPHSRTYDFLHGLGNVDDHLALLGRFDLDPIDPERLLRPVDGRWKPPESIVGLSGQFPRTVRQRWGVRSVQSRTHVLYEDITLGSAAATYHAMDVPLSVDVPGPRGRVRGYFIPDGREDPYGIKPFPSGSAGHAKARHLMPFWTAAQRGPDVLGLVVYRDDDLTDPILTNLQSHFVLPGSPDEITVAELDVAELDVAELDVAELDVAELARVQTPTPAQFTLPPGKTLTARYGTAALGVRVVAARARDGTEAEVVLVDDGNGLDTTRVTVEHHRDTPTDTACAVWWIRVGSGLTDDAAFDAWREAFVRARPQSVEIATSLIRVTVPGCQGPVSIHAQAPWGTGGPITLDPPPTTSPLELDGREIGRPLLERLPAVAAFRRTVDIGEPIRLDRDVITYWEAESGMVLPGMKVERDVKASGGRFAWQSPEEWHNTRTGQIRWELEVPWRGRYYFWARILAPDPETDSFRLSLHQGETTLVNRREWHTKRGTTWTWCRLHLDRSPEPTRLDLPAGRVQLTLHIRESGTKIDQWMATTDPDLEP